MDAHRGRILGTALVAALVTAVLTVVVAAGGTDTFDQTLRPSLRATPGTWFAHLARLLTSLGDAPVLLTVLLLAGLLVPTDAAARWRPLVLPIVATGIARLVCEVLKVGLSRPRPPVHDWLGSATGFAFPSGHASSATAGFVTLALLVGGGSTRVMTRRSWIAACVLLPVLIGASRLMLDVHWTSDVVAGWTLGLTVACAVVAVEPARLFHRDSGRRA